MKTLLLTLEFPPFKGGIANYYGNLASYWPLGENLAVLDNSRGELVKGRGFFAWRPSVRALKRKIDKGGVDYVLVGQILPLGIAAWLLSWIRPFKYGVFLHGLDLSSALKSVRKRTLAYLILRRADKIICANSFTAQAVSEFCPDAAERIGVVNPGVASAAPLIPEAELADLQKTYGLEGKTVLLSLGRLVLRKGVDQTLRALDRLEPPLRNNIAYFIAGTGPQEEYLRRLVPKSLAANIIFLGELTEKEKWTWLKACDIFIMPARNIEGDYEGFGIVYLEANLSGKPVIAGKAGGVGDAVADGVNGLLVDPEDAEAIKEAITRLSGDAALRERLGDNGRTRAIKEFNWESQTARLVEIITDKTKL